MIREYMQICMSHLLLIAANVLHCQEKMIEEKIMFLKRNRKSKIQKFFSLLIKFYKNP